MDRRRLIIVVALIIALPILFASLGGSGGTGVIIGIVLVTLGLGSMLVGSRGAEDDG
jgi:hypothetical protein